ncbi:MAG: hypothetical protein RLZZ127_2260 [Planctomycetota bacterium]|jgi:hypothetical protein
MADTTAPAAEAPATDQTWKPEPRQWSWKDLFTAPMLAFKPVAMLVSGLTVVAIAALWAFAAPPALQAAGGAWPAVVGLFGLASLLVFALGATLVSVYYKADLLDDEFLTPREALAQYAGRIVPALLVPLFLVVLVAGLFVVLLYLPGLVGSIPWIGPALYAIFYVIAFAFMVFTLLVSIAAVLGLFLFPAIVAIRRHGWFDNVVDTVEAVGTRPHVVVASLAVTFLITAFAYGIGIGGMAALKHLPQILPGDQLAKTEQRAGEVTRGALSFVPFATAHCPAPMPWNAPAPSADWESADAGYLRWGPGLVVGLLQIVITVLVLGYCMNLLLAGGMVSYLVVREDDYWDDEDLEDLDKLAKELEEEAKREEAALAAAAPAASAAAEPPKA